MDKGFVHIYTGEGKGKTTAGVGLCVRASQSGMRVAFVQMLKSGASAEVAGLEKLGVDAFSARCRKFIWQMDEAEKARCRKDHEALFEKVRKMAFDYDLMVLDEAISALACGLLDEEKLIGFLFERPETLEVVLTGRGGCEGLKPYADYYTEMKMVAHPFETEGQAARKGIEF